MTCPQQRDMTLYGYWLPLEIFVDCGDEVPLMDRGVECLELDRNRGQEDGW